MFDREKEMERIGNILFKRSNDDERKAKEFNPFTFSRTTGRAPTVNDIVFYNSGKEGKR